MSEPAVKSPCISVCVLNANDICEGCYRSAREITQWTALDNAGKRAVLEACKQRFESSNAIKLK